MTTLRLSRRVAWIGVLALVGVFGSACATQPSTPASLNGRRAAAPNPLVGPPGALKAKVDQLAQPFVRDAWVAGVSVALVTPERTETFHYGETSERGGVANDGTLYSIGSVSKVFTALLLAQEVHHGRLALTTPLAQCTPAPFKAPAHPKSPIHLGHLATHTSGLPRMPDGFRAKDPDNPYAHYDRDALFGSVDGAVVERLPGTHYAYSNLGSALLAQAVVRCADATDYPALLRARVFAPLGMDDTAVTLTDDVRKRMAQGHNAALDPVPAWDLGAFQGAGAVRSNLRDMGAFVRAVMRPPSDDWAAVHRLAMTPHGPSGNGQMGLGWHLGLGTYDLAQVVWHNGQTNGFHSFVALDPGREVGVIVLANTGARSVDLLGRALMRVMLGLGASLDLPRSAPVDPAVLARYAGTYRLNPGFAITLTVDGDRIFAQATGQRRFRVYPEDATTLHYRAVEATLKLTVDASGAASALTLHQNGRVLEMQREDAPADP